ncbi:MAG: exodeoxyribonuclease III [Acidimicrobiia bacterium]
MRIATWNVNSLKARLARVEEWIAYAKPDVLCLQETKLADAQFPTAFFFMLGYEVAYHGEGRWNGVAIASRVGLDKVVAGFPAGEPSDPEARLISANAGGVQVASLYVPNGRAVGTEHYNRKLAWLARVLEGLSTSAGPGSPMVLCGDFNVAPEDRDVWNPAAFVDATHVSEPERQALGRLRDWGLVDAFRLIHQDPGLFSWWDYRAGDFHMGRGMRIDLVYVTKPLADRVRWALIDRNARKGKLPSDHAPVLVDIDDLPEASSA